MAPYNGVWNVTGQPAASVPAGLGRDGLPRGVQVVTRPSAEATLLSLAAQLEAERPWAQARPPGFA
jgi:amidase